jgi:hypothetical protein
LQGDGLPVDDGLARAGDHEQPLVGPAVPVVRPALGLAGGERQLGRLECSSPSTTWKPWPNSRCLRCMPHPLSQEAAGRVVLACWPFRANRVPDRSRRPQVTLWAGRASCCRIWSPISVCQKGRLGEAGDVSYQFPNPVFNPLRCPLLRREQG